MALPARGVSCGAPRATALVTCSAVGSRQRARQPGNRGSGGADRDQQQQQGLTPRTPAGRSAVPTCEAATALAPSSAPDVLDRDEYRRGVGICLVNQQGLVFTAKRRDDKQNTWQMPQGGIDPYENPREAALRELREETGITSARIIASIDPWLDYQFPTKVRAQFSGQWLRYRGQTQKWFLLEFTGGEGEIDLGGQGGEPPEFSEWRWQALDALPAHVVAFKQGVYGHVARHFGSHVERLRQRNGA